MHRDDPTGSLEQEIREALREASLHSTVAGIPPELLAAVVEAGIWSPERALEAALRKADEVARARALAALVPSLEGAARARALDEVLAMKVPDVGAMCAVADHVPEPRRGEALARALDGAYEVHDERERMLQIAALAPHLPALVRAEALGLALGSIAEAQEERRGDLLAALAPAPSSSSCMPLPRPSGAGPSAP
jgi:hypothetical protein